MTDWQKAEALKAKLLRYAEYWEAQPRDWYIARQYRCTNDHVCLGHTRIGLCRECGADVFLTSPIDKTGPLDFDEELAAAELGEVVLEPDPRGSNTGHLR